MYLSSSKLTSYFFTIINLKYVQIYYQVIEKFFPRKRRKYKFKKSLKKIKIPFPLSQNRTTNIKGNNIDFTFLNITHSFKLSNIEFGIKKYGLLWAYNLNYFNFLNQSNLKYDLCIKILKAYYKEKNELISHPYPASIRLVNIIKFFTRNGKTHYSLFNELYSDLMIVYKRPEYHLHGNHLLENAISMYLGGVFFYNDKIKKTAKKLLLKELNEQILNDGMHFERSPMYHQLILERLMDALIFLRFYNDGLSNYIEKFIIKMVKYSLNWKNLSRIPMMNDSTHGISNDLSKTLIQAKKLLASRFPSVPSEMKNSYFRVLKNKFFYCLANVGEISPSYQPGHSHSDELNFELFYKESPLIVDSGVSTYEKNARRKYERSSLAHNTIVFNRNISDVWSSFRVGKRAKVVLESSTKKNIIALHEGFSPKIIKRKWTIDHNVFKIDDFIYGNSKNEIATGSLFFHPDLKVVKLDNNTFTIEKKIKIKIVSDYKLNKNLIEECFISDGFNRLKKSYSIKYMLQHKSKIIITL